MNDRIGLMIEAERRGILPPEKAGLLAEARKRGLIDTPEKSNIDALSDVGQSALTGLRQGVTGLVTAPFDLGAMGGQFLVNKAIKTFAPDAALASPMPSATQATDEAFGHVGLNYQPQTTVGEYAKTAGQFVPAATTLPAKSGPEIAKNVLRYGVIPAMASETAGQFTKGQDVEPYARMAAGIGAGGLPMGVKSNPQAAIQKTVKKIPENKAATLLREAFEEDQLTPKMVATRLESAKKTGVPVTALDVATKDIGGVRTMGANLEGLADAAANMPGRGASLAGRVASRQQKQRDRVGDYLKEALGNGEVYDITDDALNQIDVNARPAYELAHNKDFIPTDNIKSLLQRPSAKSAVARALRLAADEGAEVFKRTESQKVNPVSSEQLLDDLLKGRKSEPEIVKTVTEAFNTKGYDYIKRSLDDMIESTGKNQFGKLTNEGRILTNLKNQILNEVDSANPDFAAARRIYGDQASRKEALDLGRSFMSMDREEIARKWAGSVKNGGFSDADKIAFASGVRRHLQDLIDKSRDNADVVNRIWNENVRGKLRPIFPDNKSFMDFSRKMELERRMAIINNRLTRGSQTAPRQAFQRKINDSSDVPGMVGSAIMSPKTAVFQGAIKLMSQELKKRFGKMDSETAAQIMETLLSDDPKKILALEKIAKSKNIDSGQLINTINKIELPTLEQMRSTAEKTIPPNIPHITVYPSDRERK